jgi:N-acetylglucosamine kinase-like BadF-type ATPase
MVVLGIDVGASKTHAVLADERGCVLGVGLAGCGNWEVVGLEGARGAFVEALEAALLDAGLARSDVVASAFGIAGLDWPSDEGRLAPLIDSLGLGSRWTMVNDAFLPLRAGTADGIGLGAIAGSGTKVVGRNREGCTASSFGASYPFTDWGGGGDLAAAALHAVALAFRNMGPETALTARILAATGCIGVAELVEKLMRKEIRFGGWFAPQVFECAQAGDAVARSIARRAGETIGANVLSVAGELDMLDEPFDLVTAGGVFSSGDPTLYKSLSETVHAGARQVNVVRWQAPPVVGALLLAFDLLAFDRPSLSGLPETDRLAARVSEASASQYKRKGRLALL